MTSRTPRDRWTTRWSLKASCAAPRASRSSSTGFGSKIRSGLRKTGNGRSHLFRTRTQWRLGARYAQGSTESTRSILVANADGRLEVFFVRHLALAEELARLCRK